MAAVGNFTSSGSRRLCRGRNARCTRRTRIPIYIRLRVPNAAHVREAYWYAARRARTVPAQQCPVHTATHSRSQPAEPAERTRSIGGDSDRAVATGAPFCAVQCSASGCGAADREAPQV